MPELTCCAALFRAISHNLSVCPRQPHAARRGIYRTYCDKHPRPVALAFGAGRTGPALRGRGDTHPTCSSPSGAKMTSPGRIQPSLVRAPGPPRPSVTYRVLPPFVGMPGTPRSGREVNRGHVELGRRQAPGDGIDPHLTGEDLSGAFCRCYVTRDVHNVRLLRTFTAVLGVGARPAITRARSSPKSRNAVTPPS